MVPDAGAAPVADVGSVAAAQARSEVAAELRKPRRGRPPGTGKNQTTGGGTGQAGTAGVSPELSAELTRQLEACYDPKAWGALLAAPADVALTLTGRKHWNVSSEERATLGAAGSTAARFMSINNPRTLALMMLASALFAVYVPRLTQELAARRSEAKGAEKKPAESAA